MRLSSSGGTVAGRSREHDPWLPRPLQSRRQFASSSPPPTPNIFLLRTEFSPRWSDCWGEYSRRRGRRRRKSSSGSGRCRRSIRSRRWGKRKSLSIFWDGGGESGVDLNRVTRPTRARNGGTHGATQRCSQINFHACRRQEAQLYETLQMLGMRKKIKLVSHECDDVWLRLYFYLIVSIFRCALAAL